MDVDLDRDLQSIQQARRLASAAARAQRDFAHATQDEVDRVCAAMAAAGEREAGRLGAMAHEETGYGHADHKRIKNEFATRTVWESIRDVQTVGVLHRDEARGVVDIAWPVGVVVALSPSTNPTSTALFKILIAVKARNGIVVAGHPSAARSTAEAVRVMAEAGEAAGMPAGLVACLEPVDLGGTQELMRHPDTSMILATGGPGMVAAAHGMGKPAIGVGPGNVPAYVDRSADLDRSASDIVNSKAFDCSTICSSEQTVVADRPIADRLRAAMEAEGAYWLDDAQRRAVEAVLFRGSHGALNPEAVGRTPLQLATLAGIRVPESARVLIGEIDGVDEPALTREAHHGPGLDRRRRLACRVRALHRAAALRGARALDHAACVRRRRDHGMGAREARLPGSPQHVEHPRRHRRHHGAGTVADPRTGRCRRRGRQRQHHRPPPAQHQAHGL